MSPAPPSARDLGEDARWPLASLSSPRSSSGDFHIDTLRFLAGRARRELDAHDGRAPRDAVVPGGDRARLQHTAQVTQQRLTAAQARRRVPPAR